MLYNLFKIDPTYCQYVLESSQIPGCYVAQPWRSTVPSNLNQGTESWQYWRVDLNSENFSLNSINRGTEISNVQMSIDNWVSEYIWTANLQGLRAFIFHQPGTHQSESVRWAHAERWKTHDRQEYMVVLCLSGHSLGIKMLSDHEEQVLELKQGECVLMPAEYEISQRLETENTLFYVMTFEVFDPTAEIHGLMLELESHEVAGQADHRPISSKRRSAKKKQQVVS